MSYKQPYAQKISPSRIKSNNGSSFYIEHDEEKTFDYSQKSKDYEKKFKPKYREDRFGKRASQAAGAVITGLIGKYMQIKKNQR
tara:strand:- start:129 stop:380 length:252 start_codon:yes stop_codon:yes gene_type:complete